MFLSKNLCLQKYDLYSFVNFIVIQHGNKVMFFKRTKLTFFFLMRSSIIGSNGQNLLGYPYL